jgi:hypothetical protein
MVAHDDRLMAQLFIRLDRDRTRRERVLFGKARVQFSVGSICINSLSYLLVSRHQPGTLAPVGIMPGKIVPTIEQATVAGRAANCLVGARKITQSSE